MAEPLHHFGDPCVHCGIAHDDVAPWPCKGDPTKAVVVAYCVQRQAYQNPGSGCDTVRCAMSNGTIRDDARHPAEHWPYNSYFKNARVLSRGEFRQLYNRGGR